MTPKEKAELLIRKYYTFGINKEGQTLSWHESKQCTLIAVDELIDSHLLLTTTHDSKPSIRCKRYWLEVKQEINNL